MLLSLGRQQAADTKIVPEYVKSWACVLVSNETKIDAFHGAELFRTFGVFVKTCHTLNECFVCFELPKDAWAYGKGVEGKNKPTSTIDFSSRPVTVT